MKKIIALLLASVILLCMTSCTSNKKVLNKASDAFECVDTAFSSVNDFSKVILNGWNIGINYQDELTGEYGYYYTRYDYAKGMEFLSEQTDISLDDLKKGIAYEKYGENYEEFVNITDSYEMEDVYKSVLDSYSSKGSACLYIMISTYKATGKYAVIEANLAAAKALVKKTIDKYPEYIYTEDVKDYYITTQLYFQFLNTLAGTTYAEAVEKSNYFRNSANEYRYSFEFFLEDKTNKWKTEVTTVEVITLELETIL